MIIKAWQVKESNYQDYRIPWWMIDVAHLDLMTIRGGPVQDFFIGKR